MKMNIVAEIEIHLSGSVVIAQFPSMPSLLPLHGRGRVAAVVL